MFNSQILADTLFQNGARVTTVALTFPRSILAEFNTHKMISKNAGSSRAKPFKTLLKEIQTNPFMPVFRKNGKGMQAYEELTPEEMEGASYHWLKASWLAIEQAERLANPEGFNVHKQYVNRLLEPWMWVTVIATGTEWANLFAQRCHPAAEPSFQKIATLFYEQYKANVPLEPLDNWHLPYWTAEDSQEHQFKYNYKNVCAKLGETFQATQSEVEAFYSLERFQKFYVQDVTAGRCARVSYRNEQGEIDHLNDIRLAVQLSKNHPGHWSPFEHVVTEAQQEDMVYKLSQVEVDGLDDKPYPFEGVLGFCANLRGAKSYRRFFPNENITEMPT